MCGICGVFRRDSAPVDAALLGRMNETLRLRGPDDSGMMISGPVGLAMRRLSIIDLAGGKQPVANESEDIHIVFNGEIYNFLELRAELQAKGHTFRTRSDTEVIVHLYEEMGEACVEKLNGMFAFALWDNRTRKLCIARDRLGIKPLFYGLDPKGNFYFGSELKAVLQAPIPREMDRQAVHDYLSLMYVPTPATLYRHARKLPPGSLMIVDDTGVVIKQYWDLPLPRAGEEDTGGPYEEEIIDRIETAVRRQMIADVPIGALLSGGLDSTTVTAVMTTRLNAPVNTFTIGFTHRSYDESTEARLVAETLGADHTELIATPDMIESIPDLLNGFDEPFADYSALPTFLVSRLAAQKVKVVLTGDGGDEIFAGYPTYTAYRLSRIYRLIPGFIRNGLIRPLVFSLPTSMERISFDYKAKAFVTGANLPFEEGHYWWKVIFSEEDKQRLLAPEFRSGLHDSFEAFRRHFRKAAHADPINQLLYVDMKTFLLDDNLTKVDRMTMANSLEARVPLLDHELVERMAVIPPREKSRGLETKRLLRRAVKTMLPPAIRKGAKKGFTPPLPFWISRELRPLIEDHFREDVIRDTGFLNPHYCRGLLDEHFSGKRDNNRRIWTLFALICRMRAGL